ncbi:hypothetical protein ACWGNU_28780 [Paenibacillus lautus]
MKPFMKWSAFLILGTFLLSACSEQTATKESVNRDIETKVNYESEPKNTEAELHEEEPKEVSMEELDKESVDETAVIDWELALKELASEGSSKTEKADAAERLARDYKPNDDELADFQKFIVDEFKSGKYLADSGNDAYMLSNIFRSVVVNRSIEESQPISEFAYDFYQNSKFVYRGADTVDSDSVKSNEEQMNKSLQEIK